MRTIKIWLTIGYPGADRKWEVEIEDNMTTEEIEDLVREEAHEYIEYGWNEKD